MGVKRIWIEGEHLLGDYLMQTPAIRGLRAKYRDTPIFYVTPEGSVSRPLIVNNPDIHKVYTLAQCRVLADRGDLHFQGDAGQAFSVSRQTNCSMAEAWCRLWNVPYDGGWYSLNVPAACKDEFTIPAPFVVLGRHSRSCTSNDPKIRVANKCMPNTFWNMVARYLLERGITPVTVGALQDQSDPVYKDMPEGCYPLYGAQLMSVAGVLQRAAFTISVDTGIRHMAAAVGGNLLTLNSAIPLSIIRCEPRTSHQKVVEIEIDIQRDLETFTQIQPIMEELLIHARRSHTPS